eukprot:TRINITY_DN42825_c0_g1_i1.p1 TRINITY_DN42825_c0_g1~~TRINITY_DN42825_c0_g1_i1.p1  ORF type:complete len:152 (+),score=30.92 TRINITY_DN42825_c0_g1_i1:119-574(+)
MELFSSPAAKALCVTAESDEAADRLETVFEVLVVAACIVGALVVRLAKSRRSRSPAQAHMPGMGAQGAARSVEVWQPAAEEKAAAAPKLFFVMEPESPSSEDVRLRRASSLRGRLDNKLGQDLDMTPSTSASSPSEPAGEELPFRAVLGLL